MCSGSHSDSKPASSSTRAIPTACGGGRVTKETPNCTAYALRSVVILAWYHTGTGMIAPPFLPRARSLTRHVRVPGRDRRDALAASRRVPAVAVHRPDERRVRLVLARAARLDLPAVDDARLGGRVFASLRGQRLRVVRRRLRVRGRHHDP